MSETIAGITIPDTTLVHEATARVRDATNDTLFNHCRRVFLLGSLKAARRGLHVDAELAYVGAMFHDLDLTTSYRTTDRRFELDGAEVAREFLLDHGRSPEEALRVWLAIALHTTPEVPLHLAPEIAVVTLGVESDVLGFDLDEISSEHRNEVIAAYPRPEFKERILHAFYVGMADRPQTTFGTMNDDVLAHFDPTFRRQDFVEIIRNSSWPG